MKGLTIHHHTHIHTDSITIAIPYVEGQKRFFSSVSNCFILMSTYVVYFLLHSKIYQKRSPIRSRCRSWLFLVVGHSEKIISTFRGGARPALRLDLQQKFISHQAGVFKIFRNLAIFDMSPMSEFRVPSYSPNPATGKSQTNRYLQMQS